ncbi:Asp23/Gls24 family envelope stress response protein [Herbivorax sp. ANBcel31]|uniref:Asp23/Gls24 family envelope stress response protein n=1 Tax=Herbivorax sp. ANBcel31 TaxID=3069754 RepID=UPI0027B5B202|nr:Asp23/Gls24 family envelope stress response protein [Herbivorax sp. ANBcel31]MDQ2086427.1 Asp23/Gls24 family envelope stress response protein [Herbivorax sp. ANBcel31]
MKVVGFVGPSGTGKSHRAVWVAREREIDFIIDDGLLIRGTQIIAGTSAKREKTKVGSIKRALFKDDEHANQIKMAINHYNPDSMLVLGTSDGMVESIAKSLGYSVSEKIYIHEIATEFEIKQALSTRKEQGKHVIPVPTFEIKKDFSGYFLDPLQIFRRKGKGSFQLVGEKSVVRPTFSYLGNYTISDYTVYQIVEHVTSSMEGVKKISRFRAENRPDGIYIEMDLVLIYGYKIKPLLREIQKKVIDEVEKLTALNIKKLNIVAKSLAIESKKQQDKD